MDEQTHRMRSIHTMEYYSAFKRNAALLKTRINLENIMRSERS